MSWSGHGGRLARSAAAFLSRRLPVSCLETGRLLSAASTLPATSLPLSPAVRYLVDTNSLDPSLIPASGPHSRLLKGDVLWYMETGMGRDGKASSAEPSTQPPPPPSPSLFSPSPFSPPPHPPSLKPLTQTLDKSTTTKFTDIAVDDGRRSHAFTSVQSKMSIPHSTASIHCEVGSLLSSLQHAGRGRAMIMLESYFIKAAAATLKQLPHSNAVWNEDRLLLLPSVNISVRVSREGRLLPAPVIIRDADRASVQSIASAIERAQSGDNGALPAPSASLMVSSLLSSSLSHYTDLVQSPHSAVLSLAGVQRVLSEEECGRSSSATVAICLSSDSRVLNSDLSSEWLQQFRNNVEMLAIAGV